MSSSGHEAEDGDGAGEGVVVDVATTFVTFGVAVAASSIFLFRGALFGKSLLDKEDDAEVVVVWVGVCGGVGVRDDGGVG